MILGFYSVHAEKKNKSHKQYMSILYYIVMLMQYGRIDNDLMSYRFGHDRRRDADGGVGTETKYSRWVSEWVGVRKIRGTDIADMWKRATDETF